MVWSFSHHTHMKWKSILNLQAGLSDHSKLFPSSTPSLCWGREGFFSPLICPFSEGVVLRGAYLLSPVLFRKRERSNSRQGKPSDPSAGATLLKGGWEGRASAAGQLRESIGQRSREFEYEDLLRSLMFGRSGQTYARLLAEGCLGGACPWLRCCSGSCRCHGWIRKFCWKGELSGTPPWLPCVYVGLSHRVNNMPSNIYIYKCIYTQLINFFRAILDKIEQKIQSSYNLSPSPCIVPPLSTPPPEWYIC